MWLTSGRGVEQAGHPEAGVAHAAEDVRPFAGFEGDAIGAVKARRDEADALGRAGGEDAGAHGDAFGWRSAQRLRKRGPVPIRRWPQLPRLPAVSLGGFDVVVEAVADHEGFARGDAARLQAGGEDLEDVRVGFAEAVLEGPETESRSNRSIPSPWAASAS